MKALEILRWSQDKAPNNYLDFLCGEEWDNLIKEAIKELEDLKERILHLQSIETDMIMEEIRSCIGCVNSIKSNSQDCISCSRQYKDNFKIIKNKHKITNI